MKKMICLLMMTLFVFSFASGPLYAKRIPFDDVAENGWYYDAVCYCYENSLMKGVSNEKFDHSGKVTREQFVQALANLEEAELEKYEEAAKETPFSDVPAGKWYSAAIEWSRSNEIVEGISDSLFGLGQVITREQMATILERYAEYKGRKTDYTANLDNFSDSAEISAWALGGVNYAAALGLFKGNDKNEFSPLGKTTRAELAVVLQRASEFTRNRIICWGDSLTMGIETGWGDIVDIPYPERLGEYLGVESINNGIGSEWSDMIAMRQGAIPVYVNNITIPADCTPVAINQIITDTNYPEITAMGVYGFQGINDVEIAGISGKLTGYDVVNYQYTKICFTRNTPGEAVKIEEKTRIITQGMKDASEEDILVIWSGSNDLYGQSNLDYVEKIIENQQKMVDYAGTDKFVVVGFTANNYIGSDSFRECADLANEMLAEYWGDKYLDIKEYMATEQALLDHGIEPTERDLEYLAKGWIPVSFLENGINLIHFNQLGYDIAADMVAEKIVELGYLG